MDNVRKLVHMLWLLAAIEAAIAVVTVGLWVQVRRVQGDVAKIAVGVETLSPLGPGAPK